MNLKLVIEADSATLINLLKLLPNANMTAEVTAPIEPSLPFVAPAPSATPAPAPAPVPVPSATASSEPMFDETGLAWDERIHAPSKTMTADGSWRKRRNTDDATYAAVEAELRAKYPNVAYDAAPQPVAAPVTAPVGNDAPVPMVSGVADAATVTSEYVPTPPVAVAVPTPEPIVPVVAPVPTPPVATEMDFPSLLQAVGTGISTGTLATDKVATTVQTLNATYGLTMQSLADLGDKPNLIQPAYNLLFGQ